MSPPLSTGAVALLSACLVVLGLPTGACATPADTTWVTTFDHDFYNWADAHIDTFQFPPAGSYWSEILLYYEIGCPEAPGDCDPWDRLGHLRVLHEDSTDTVTPYEIARIITPYDITGGSYPGTCTWVLDVSDYESILHDTVVLRNYIESWIGGDRGWLVTIRFAFVAGYSELEPFRVINLWSNDRAVYGDPSRPIEDHLQPLSIDIDSGAEAVKFRAIVTGHGQGNTDNAAEFSNKWHAVDVGPDNYSHFLWRNDCAQNTCSPQGGSWWYNRAGWCPGDKVIPWDVDVTSSVTPGASAVLDYNIQPYENFCRPNNPDCVSGVTCPDCEYNYTGHTEPHYTISTQLIVYRERAVSAVDAGQAMDAGEGLRLERNYPNPFNPTTTFHYSVDAPAEVTIAIYSAMGRIVREIRREHATPGRFEYTWDGRDGNGERMPSGVYFYEVQSQEASGARKMILLQ